VEGKDESLLELGKLKLLFNYYVPNTQVLLQKIKSDKKLGLELKLKC